MTKAEQIFEKLAVSNRWIANKISNGTISRWDKIVSSTTAPQAEKLIERTKQQGENIERLLPISRHEAVGNMIGKTIKTKKWEKGMDAVANKFVTLRGDEITSELNKIKLRKNASINWGQMGKDYLLPSLVIGPVAGAAVTAATSDNKEQFKKNIGKGMGAGIVADVLTGVGMGLWKQRQNIMKATL
jgi:hypothetical protein